MMGKELFASQIAWHSIANVGIMQRSPCNMTIILHNDLEKDDYYSKDALSSTGKMKT
jgi:hypothetical protein